MHSAIERTPKHELIVGIYEPYRRNNFGKLVDIFYEREDIALDELLRIACRDANPSLDQEINRNRINAIKNLLKKGANPAAIDDEGCNALMLLFEYAPNFRSHESITDKIYLASEGRFQDEVKGEYVNWLYFNERRIYEDSEQEEFERISNDPNFSGSVRRKFKPDENELKQYEEKLNRKISDYKLEIAREIIPLLLEKVDLNTRNKSDKTALIIADEAKDEIFKQVLLEKGANDFDLKRQKPEYKYLIDQEDYKNICCQKAGNKWTPFIKAIWQSVKNKKSEPLELPFAKLNSDNSISFFVSTVADQKLSGSFDDHSENFRNAITQDFIVEQLNFHAKEFGFTTLEDRPLLETLPVQFNEDMIEYRINLSPQNFDSILKLNPFYTGYRNEGSILKLNREFSVQEGWIRLFPVFKINAEDFLIQAAGCQLYEMPTLQLMHLLPNYENEILPKHQAQGFYFHWVPKEVEEALLLNRSNISNIITKIFSDNGLVIDGGKTLGENPQNIKIADSSKINSLRIVKIDQDAQDFYLMYGNNSAEELRNCLALEVETLSFLQAIDKYYDGLKASEYLPQEQIDYAKKNIQSMIETETKKKSMKNISGSDLESAINSSHNPPKDTTKVNAISHLKSLARNLIKL
ncbi:MAG: hypothetical protein SFV53_06945 [Rickettsiales bacterium]|nr:hypothetical protein [Rickettsiales bacterium]